MDDRDLIMEWIGDLVGDTRREIEALPSEALAWRPDAEANSIGVTVWHYCRWLDLLAVQAIQNRPQSEEQWFTRGWAARTGYDPSGIGLNGLGAITGYTQEEVAAIPAMSAEDLLTYLTQACTALVEQLRALPAAGLQQPAPGLGGERTVYSWLRGILKGALRHLGEVAAIKSMWERQAAR
ncbi:MAG: DinB family protein [Anaerolineales bacterium]